MSVTQFVPDVEGKGMVGPVQPGKVKSIGTNVPDNNIDKTIPTTPNFDYHNEYYDNQFDWTVAHHCFNQEIKRYCHVVGIIPPPGLLDPVIGDDPRIKEQAKYIVNKVAVGSTWTARAKLYAALGFDSALVSKTAIGLVSLATQYKNLVVLPDKLAYLADRINTKGEDIENLYSQILAWLLVYGRLFVIADIDETENKFVLNTYKPLNVINWGVQYNNGKEKLDFVVTVHYENNPDYNPLVSSSERDIKIETYHYIDHEDNIYKVVRYKSIDGNYKTPELITPSFMGRTIDFIPGVFVGSIDNTAEVDPIPLKIVAEAQVGIFQTTCRKEHALANSAEPFLFAAGADPDDMPTFLGAGSLVSLPDPSASLKYVQPDSGIFNIIQEQVQDYYVTAQEAGASLLGSRKSTSESGEALRLRQANVTAPLKQIVNNVGVALNRVLKYIAIWANVNDENVEFSPNKEFSTFALTANETIALVQSWQSGGISHSTMLENFRKAGMLKPGESAEDEIATLKQPGERWEPLEQNNQGQVELNAGQNLPKSTQMDKKIKR